LLGRDKRLIDFSGLVGISAIGEPPFSLLKKRKENSPYTVEGK